MPSGQTKGGFSAFLATWMRIMLPILGPAKNCPPVLWVHTSPVDTVKTVELLLEGVALGTCELTVEIREYQPATPETPAILAASKVRVQVNVDQTPNPNADLIPGVALSGRQPHYAGVDYGNILAGQPSSSIVALRGRFRAEIPAFQTTPTKWRPQLTGRHNKLRTADQSTEFTLRSTASFWFGVRTLDNTATSPLGSGTCWVQSGLLFSQLPQYNAPNMDVGGSKVQYYLETGRHAPTVHSGVNHKTISEFTPSYTAALKDWETRGILLDFIMFARPTGRDWLVACKDARDPLPGQAAQEVYFLLDASPPAGPPPPGNVAIDDAIDIMHTNARYVLPQVKMELTNAAGFLFGNPGKPAGVENLRFATSLTGTTNPSGDAKGHWLWADGQAGFNWAAMPLINPLFNRPRIQFTTGLNSDNISLSDAGDHVNRYFWHCRLPGAAANTVEFFDERFWAFPAARR